MPNYSKRIVYLTEAQRKELFLNDTITVDGVTVTYNENDIYVTPQEMQLSVGTVTTLSPGSSATASITGDPEDMTLNLGIPQGAQGIQGPQGDDYVLTSQDKTEIADLVTTTGYVETVTGTDPTITGTANTRYICGELTSLTVTPPSAGTISVLFTSGTTPTVLSLPQTCVMPEWWEGVEADYTYELLITDATYVGVMSWPA